MNRKCIKNPILLAIFICFLLMSASYVYARQKTGRIKLVVVGIKSDKGFIIAGLNNNKEAYNSRGKIKAFKSARMKVKKRRAEYVFKKVPYGEYTIKLYHDENGNRKLDTNLLGIPVEDYGISNNAKGRLGLPDYDKAKFRLDSKQTVITVKMI